MGALVVLSAALLAQSPQPPSPPPCPADRPVDDILAQMKEQQSKKKNRNKNPLSPICIAGWCIGTDMKRLRSHATVVLFEF